MDSFDGSRRRDWGGGTPPAERRPLRESDARAPREVGSLDQRLDRWVSAGRQLVDGVSGGRPGSRPTGRRPEGRLGPRGGIDGLGRWVEERLDWLLDDGDDWREPWQEGGRPLGAEPTITGRSAAAPGRSSAEPPAPPATPRRRPLEARSRRGQAAALGPDGGRSGLQEDWPEDEAFTVPRWRRPAAPIRPEEPPAGAGGGSPERGQGGARPLPRSSRRR